MSSSVGASSSQSNVSFTFETFLINKATREKSYPLITDWEKKACAKKDLATDKKDKMLFEDCEDICRVMGSNKLNPALSKDKSTKDLKEYLTICRDTNFNEIQALCIHKVQTIVARSKGELGQYLSVSFLVTNPNNVRSKLNENELSKVKGASTAMMKQLAKACIADNLAGIYLETIKTARTFYLGLKFTYLDPTEVVVSEPEADPMHLTTKKIKSLFAEK